MKKFFATLLVIGLLITMAAYAEEKTEVKLNASARFYPTRTNFGGGINYDHSNIWLEGNLFWGKDFKWKGTIEWFGASKTNTYAGIGVRYRQNQYIGRFAYDVSRQTFITLSYKLHAARFNVAGYGSGSGNFDGFGLGVDKKWKMGDKWDIHTNLHYYPSLQGPNRVDFRDLEYEIGGVYKIPNSVNIDFGWRGESWSGYNNATGVNPKINGPYIGVSKEF